MKYKLNKGNLKNLKFLTVFLLLIGGEMFGQNCYIQLSDATGIDMSSKIQNLEDKSCNLKDAFPIEFQSQFKVFDFGFYSMNEYMQGGFASFWNKAVEDAQQQAEYYLLFGKQLPDSKGVSKIWFAMNLPTTGELECIQPAQLNYLENLLREILNETDDPYDFARLELDVVEELTEWVTFYVNCCQSTCEEICDNEIDDDKDGLVDCDDIDCLYQQIGFKSNPVTTKKSSTISCYVLNEDEKTCISSYGAFYESLGLDTDEAMFLCRNGSTFNIPDNDFLDWLIQKIKDTGNELARRVLIKTIQHMATYAENQVEAYLENLIQNGTPFQISMGIFIEFATGLGPEHRHFDQDHPLTISLKESNYTCLALKAWHDGYLEVIDTLNSRTQYPPGYRVDFVAPTSSFPFMDLGNTGPIREFIADGGYTAAQFIGTGYFDFDYDTTTQILSLELYDSKTLYSLLLHLVDDRHPRSQSPFWGETSQTYEFTISLSEIETKINDCD